MESTFLFPLFAWTLFLNVAAAAKIKMKLSAIFVEESAFVMDRTVRGVAKDVK